MFGLFEKKVAAQPKVELGELLCTIEIRSTCTRFIPVKPMNVINPRISLTALAHKESLILDFNRNKNLNDIDINLWSTKLEEYYKSGDLFPVTHAYAELMQEKLILVNKTPEDISIQ